MCCWLYEGILIFAVVFVAGWLLTALGPMRGTTPLDRYVLQGFLLVVLGLYFTWFWAKGQTLAMKTWRIRVVGTDGLALSQRRALLRFLLCWLWFVPPMALLSQVRLQTTSLVGAFVLWIALWALVSRLHRLRQFWHDEWAGTRLIDSGDAHRE